MPRKRKRSISPDDVAGVLFDPSRNQQIIVTNDLLLNQIGRDAPRIAQEVIATHRSELLEVSGLFARAHFLSLSGFIKAARSGDQLFSTLTALVHNAGGSVAAAASLICQGFRLQPIGVLRNCLENLGVASHLFLRPDELPRFQSGDLDSPKTIGSLKKLVPPMGGLYGLYSETFAHIGPLYGRIELPKRPAEDDQALPLNMAALRVGTWAFYVIAELLSVAHLGNNDAQYWRPVGNGVYAYDPAQPTRDAMAKFLHGTYDPGQSE